MGKLHETVFVEVPPRRSLAGYVDGLWYSQAITAHVIHILPTTRSALMSCSTPYGKGIVLVGPMSSAQSVSMASGDAKVGAWLKPGARYLFQRYEPYELRDRVVVGRNMTTSLVAELEERMAGNYSVQEKLEHLQDFIEEMIRRNLIMRHKTIDRFVNGAVSTHNKSVAGAVQDLSVSYRHFSRLVKHYTGFTAKDFLRLQRLRAASRTIDDSKQSLAIIAAEHQYADHAHLTREFKSKIGISPSAFDTYQSI